MQRDNRGSWTLIGLLAAVAIVVVLTVVLMGKFGGGTVKDDSKLLDTASQKETTYGRAMDTGRSVDCREHLNQIRTAVAQEKAMSGTEDNPASLKALRMSVNADYFQCPVTKQPYQYDQASGTVHCPSHPNF
jgi:hypothetical protein